MHLKEGHNYLFIQLQTGDDVSDLNTSFCGVQVEYSNQRAGTCLVEPPLSYRCRHEASSTLPTCGVHDQTPGRSLNLFAITNIYRL